MRTDRYQTLFLTCCRCRSRTVWYRRTWWNATARRWEDDGNPGACTCGSKLWSVDLEKSFPTGKAFT